MTFLIDNPIRHLVTAGIPGFVKKFIKQNRVKKKKKKSILKWRFKSEGKEVWF